MLTWRDTALSVNELFQGAEEENRTLGRSRKMCRTKLFIENCLSNHPIPTTVSVRGSVMTMIRMSLQLMLFNDGYRIVYVILSQFAERFCRC